MDRQKIIHFNSIKQGDEFLNAMAQNAEYNEIIIQHTASGEGETSLWTLESVNGVKTPIKFPNEESVQGMVNIETMRAMSAETALQEAIDNLEQDSSLYSVYVGHVDDSIVSENDPTVIPGTGDTALCFIYKMMDDTYKLVAINVENFIEENEFEDGLIVNDHVVKVLINPNSDSFISVDENGILISGISVTFDELQENIDAEVDRAMSAETELQENIEAEEERAKEAEAIIQEYAESETERAQSAETMLAEAIDDETARAMSAETALQETIEGSIEAEEERAKEAEQALDEKIDSEIDRAMSAETELQQNIDDETVRAISAEQSLKNKIDNEIERASDIETILTENIEELGGGIEAEEERAKEAEQILNDSINDEESRATAAEGVLDAKIDDETARAISAETALLSEINNEASRAIDAEVLINSEIDNLEDTVNDEIARAQSAETVLQEAIDALDSNIESEIALLFDRAEYDSNAKEIKFYHGSTELDSIDATAFIKDGMVESVEVKEVSGVTSLVITFNTDGEKEDIVIPISSIFDADNYYTKQDVDGLLDSFSAATVAAIDAEEARAEGVEQVLSGDVIDEINRATAAEETLDDKIDAEIDRAMSAETILQENIDTVEEKLSEDIDDLDAIMLSEVDRAMVAEEAISASVITLSGNVASAVNNEASRAMSAETELDDRIDEEAARAMLAETELQENIDDEETRAITAEITLQEQIDTINTKILIIDCGRY